MTTPLVARSAPIALAALLTTAMLFATNALASHQYRVASTAQAQARVAVIDVQHGTIVGHRIARA